MRQGDKYSPETGITSNEVSTQYKAKALLRNNLHEDFLNFT